MANKNGIITRKDIIEDEALKFGEVYANNLKVAIEANKRFVKDLKAIAPLMDKIQKSANNAEYIRAKNEETLATQNASNALKLQLQLEVSAQKSKQEAVKTEKSALDLKSKKAKVDKEIASLLSQEEKLLQQKNRNLSEEEKLEQQRLKTQTILLRIEKARLDGDKKKEASELKKLKQQELSNRNAAVESVNQGILARNAKDYAIITSKLTSELQKLDTKVRQASRAYLDIKLQGQKAGESTAQFTLRLERARIEFDRLKDKSIAANRAIRSFNDNVGNYPQQAFSALKDFVLAFGAVEGISSFSDVVKNAFGIIRDFEAEVVNLAAVSGNSREEIAPLEKEIRRVAKSAVNGATDVAKLATELIKLGSTPEEATKLLEPINNLSIALRATAEDAATLVKSTLNAYGLGADDAAHVTDVLAEAANRSALDFQGLRDALGYVAPVAKTLGISVEKTAALIGTLADNGIKAESAGRLLGTGLGKIAGQGLTLEQALAKINKAQQSGASSLEVLSTANDLFGTEAGKLALILANNTQKVIDSTKAYENSAGSLKELTDKQLKSLDAELKTLDSAWEDYILSTNDAIGGTKIFTTSIRFLSDNLSEIITILAFAASGWVAYKAALILANLQTRLMALSAVSATEAQAANVVVTGFGTAAQTANAAATTVATTAWQRFNAALKANALLLIISGLVTAIYFLNKYSKTLEENISDTKESTDVILKNRETIEKNSDSINKLSDRYDELTSKADKLGGVTKLSVEEQKELNKIIVILAKTVPGATTAVDLYGNAIAVSTVKTRAFNQARADLNKTQSTIELIKNTKILKELTHTQELLNKAQQEGSKTYIDGIGTIVKRNGILLVSYGGILNLTREMTLEEKAGYQQFVVNNLDRIASVTAQINALRGLTKAQKDAAIAAATKASEDAKNAPRTIEIIDAEIKAEKEKIDQLTFGTRAEGVAIDAKIKALEAERDAIYNNDKADKKRHDNGLKRAKELADAIFDLNQQHYKNEIDFNQLISDDENRSIDDRLDALYTLEKARVLSNDERVRNELYVNALDVDGVDKLSKAKFKIYKEDAKTRIEQLLSGTIAVSNQTAEEKLILKKYYDDKAALQIQDGKDKQVLLDSQTAILERQLDKEGTIQDTILQDELRRENERYQAKINAATGGDAELQDLEAEHQRKINKIQFDAAKKTLDIQVKLIEDLLAYNDALPEAERISTEERIKLVNKLAKAKKDASEVEVSDAKTTSKAVQFIESQKTQTILTLSSNLATALTDLSNALSASRVQRIDEEIEKNNQYYALQIELAGNDARKKEALQKELARKNEELEKKKRKEAHKQAVKAKILAIAQATINAALAAIKGFADAGIAGAILGAAAGAVAIAAIIATPIPKEYKHGRKGGIAEDAIIDDGGKKEVVSRQDGSEPRMTSGNSATPTLVHLDKDDVVHTSVDAYKDYMKKATLSNVNYEGARTSNFQTIVHNDGYSKELLEELKNNTKAIKNNKPLPQRFQKMPDINHQIWLMSGKKWHN